MSPHNWRYCSVTIGVRVVLKNEIDANRAFLANNGWLGQTPRDFAEAFLSHCHWRHVGSGVAIQHAGDTIGSITGIAHGTISITTALSTPDAPMTHIGHPGIWIGYVSLFDNNPLPMSITTRSDVMLASISQPGLEALLSNRPQWWRHIGGLGVIYGNLAVNVAADLMIRDSRRRCCASLLRLADCRFADRPGAQPTEAPLSQEELAAISNLSRTSVSGILHDLEASGLISLGYRAVTLNDTARLRAIVDGV